MTFRVICDLCKYVFFKGKKIDVPDLIEIHQENMKHCPNCNKALDLDLPPICTNKGM